jgi:methionine-rich copper-binding protein CopC
MTTRAGDYMESSVVGVRRTSPSLDEAHRHPRDAEASRRPDPESSKPTGTIPRSIGIGTLAGFLVVMVVVGSAAALAWRTHADLPLIAELQREDTQRLEAAIQRLELMQQQLTQRVDALQLLQQKTQQSQQADVQRLSERVTSLQVELEKKLSSGSKEPVQKRRSNAAPKEQSSSSALDTAQQSAVKPSVKLQN